MYFIWFCWALALNAEESERFYCPFRAENVGKMYSTQSQKEHLVGTLFPHFDGWHGRGGDTSHGAGPTWSSAPAGAAWQSPDKRTCKWALAHIFLSNTESETPPQIKSVISTKGWTVWWVEKNQLAHEDQNLLLFFFFFLLAVPCGIQDLSSPTRDRTRAPCGGSVQSWPLDRQGISRGQNLNSIPHLLPNSPCLNTYFLSF